MKHARMGVVPSDIKQRRRRAARWRFLLEHPEPPDVYEWEKLHPNATKDEREAAEWAREEWEGLAHEKARPYFRKPTAKQAERQRAARMRVIVRKPPAWMKDIDWGGADTDRREQRLAKRARSAAQRARSWSKYTSYIDDYCASQCTRYTTRVDELQRRKRALWKDRPDAGTAFDRLDRQIAKTENAARRCEQSCFDKELGRGYRKARGFEFTGRKIPKHAAAQEQAKYRELIRERDRGEAPTYAARVRKKLEEGLIEKGGPVILPHKGYSDIHRQRSFIQFQTNVCARLKKVDKQKKCRKRIVEMRARLAEIIQWHRDRCKGMSDKAARRECLRQLRAG